VYIYMSRYLQIDLPESGKSVTVNKPENRYV
jgi:hypothetical protein